MFVESTWTVVEEPALPAPWLRVVDVTLMLAPPLMVVDVVETAVITRSGVPSTHVRRRDRVLSFSWLSRTVFR